MAGQQSTGDEGLMGTISARPSSMSGFSHGLYGPSSFCSLPLCGSVEQSELSHTLSLHEESAETDCFASCSPTSSIVLVPPRPRSDPSTDCQYVLLPHWSLSKRSLHIRTDNILIQKVQSPDSHLCIMGTNIMRP